MVSWHLQGNHQKLSSVIQKADRAMGKMGGRDLGFTPGAAPSKRPSHGGLDGRNSAGAALATFCRRSQGSAPKKASKESIPLVKSNRQWEAPQVAKWISSIHSISSAFPFGGGGICGRILAGSFEPHVFKRASDWEQLEALAGKGAPRPRFFPTLKLCNEAGGLKGA